MLKYSTKTIFVSTIIAAFCSILYELLLAQTLTVVFGGSVLRYSTTIGLYLFALGLGSMFHKFTKSKPLRNFILIELILSIVGSFSILFIFYIARWQGDYDLIILLVSHSIILLIGFLSGLEIPLLTELAQREKFADVLGYDYFGSLLGAVFFPLYLYPEIGLVAGAIYIGFINFCLALFFSFYYRRSSLFLHGGRRIMQDILFIGMMISFVVLVSNSSNVQSYIQKTYKKYYLENNFSFKIFDRDVIEIVDDIQTPYQDITYVKEKGEPLLFLDKNIQLSDSWIKSFHESFAVGSLLFSSGDELNIAVLGGGDGILVEKLLDSGKVGNIDFIDIDEKFVTYMKNHPHYSQFNKKAFSSSKVNIVYEDAFYFMKKGLMLGRDKYDLIFIDFASLNNNDKSLYVYSEEFYSFCNHNIKDDGILTVWTYPENNFLEVFNQTVFNAGFKYKNSFTSLIESGDKNRNGQHYMMLSNTKVNEKKNLYWNMTDYQEKVSKEIKSENWKELVDLGVKSNSIFLPNYNMLSKN